MNENTALKENRILSDGVSLCSDKEHPVTSLNLILLGKKRAEKSATANTILGREAFSSKKIIKTVHKESVMIDGVNLDVYCPESKMEDLTKNKVLSQLNESAFTVVLLVMKSEIVKKKKNRFFGHLRKSEKTIEQIDKLPNWLRQNMWIIFTRGDELETANLTIEELIEQTTELKRIIEKLQNRYHVFNNKAINNPDQVIQLIKKINRSKITNFAQIIQPKDDPLARRIVLLGKTGAGKSAIANTILGEERFISELCSASVTAESEMEQAVVGERKVTIVDTPGLCDTSMSAEDLAVKIGRSVYLSSPGPHAFLYVLQINIKVTEQEEEVHKLEMMFGLKMRKYTIILFTQADQLEGKSPDSLIKKNKSLCRLVEQCGGFHVFNNKDLSNREQVTELMEKIDRMVKKNGGSCYSNQMFEREDKQQREERQHETKRMGKKAEEAKLRQENHSGAAREVETSHNTIIRDCKGAAVRAAVGGNLGGPLGAVVGAGIGAAVESAGEAGMEKLMQPIRRVVAATREVETSHNTIIRDCTGAAVGAAVGGNLGGPLGVAVGAGVGAAVESAGEAEVSRVEIPHISQDHEEKEEEKRMPEAELTRNRSQCEDKIAEIEQLFNRLNLFDKQEKKKKTSDVLQITKLSLQFNKTCPEKDLVETILQRLLMLDYSARYITVEKEDDSDLNADESDEELDDFFYKKTIYSDRKEQKHPVHSMDLQMAVFHCSDNFLKQLIVTKLSQCQYALPLLVPNPFTREIEFPLWTFRQIKKSWKSTDEVTSKTKPICDAETPMVAFFRLGSISSSKSQLMNSLINEKHNTFFHRHCPGSSRNRLLMDGVVEIAWYCPSGKKADHFTDCVAFCNLHGDAVINKEQLEILSEMSTVNVILVSDTKESTNKKILHKLFKDPKPLICLLSEDDSGVIGTKNGKYRIGLKNRSLLNVSSTLKKIIKQHISKSLSNFRIEDLRQINSITTDEDESECKTGKEAAIKMNSYLEGKELSVLKTELLPCQGKLWHDWCELNKSMYRLEGHNLEIQKSKIQTEMKAIREQQHKYGLSDFMKEFICTLKSLEGNQKYFLKWVGFLLDKFTSDDLLALYHEYNAKWTQVLDLKKEHNKSDKIKDEQTELEKLSRKLNAATFGLEHIIREMGQIYESFVSVQREKKISKQEDFSFLPKLAAEIIESGLPVELMDGDAAHVPLIWVEAVLDELIKIIGNKRVFVLSVLGIQSSGKSTLLNAMFGLQFAVSAGRCTRGAFMQLVSVSEDMKRELKFDYILVVDTEGLRALELAGESTHHHDNELATFVIGLGNLTLINIFGENPAEMQDILQIVIQAFMRMKKVRVNPSCIFVHQNVGDITAEEKTMEGRRRLQETLDKMTKLAAKETHSSAECFSDVIAFDVKTDVQYFAQLWEGSPPMAPPNPSYSRNVHELKNKIFSKAFVSNRMTLSQFKTSICDLWNALLNEDFVFSFKNTLEIAVYRKLETEFGKWSWSLRSAMLEIEEKMHNRIENGNLKRVEDKDLYDDMKKTKNEVKRSMKQYFEEDRDKHILIQWQAKCENNIAECLKDLVKKAKRELNEVIQKRNAREKFESKKTEYDQKLLNLSKELAQNLKHKETDEEVLKKEFDQVWDKWVPDLTKDTDSIKTFNFWEDAMQIISVENDQSFVYERLSVEEYKNIDKIGDYSHYIILNKLEKANDEGQYTTDTDMSRKKTKDKKGEDFSNLSSYFSGDKNQVENQGVNADYNILVGGLAVDIIKECKKLIDSLMILKPGYKDSFIQEITEHIKNRSRQFQDTNLKINLRKEFLLDLCLNMCSLAEHRCTELNKMFRDANDPRVYLEKQKPQYYNVFRNYCRGATTTTVFGELICNNLESSILEAVYNKTAIDLASRMRSDMPEFNGNRSNLEKHILTSLAEEENFEKYLQYINNPEKHFRHFITAKVNKYISQQSMALDIFKRNLKDKEHCVLNAVHMATEEVKTSSGDADMWLKIFASSLKDHLNVKEITCGELKEISDFDFLKQIVTDGVVNMISNQHNSFNSAAEIKMEKCRKRPDEILIEHLCQCCWVQCPFCNAICTNTMKDHVGDHSVPFHRIDGIIGCYYRGTKDLSADFCTTNVQSEIMCYPNANSDESFPYKQYRTAGGKYASWSITPDNSELQYWKWFVCRFQGDLEKHYGKPFRGNGEIPSEWRKYSKEQAIKCLDEYI